MRMSGTKRAYQGALTQRWGEDRTGGGRAMMRNEISRLAGTLKEMRIVERARNAELA